MAMQVEEMYLQKLETGQLHMYVFYIYVYIYVCIYIYIYILVSYLDNLSEEAI